MAICKDNKYSLNELQRFSDRIENVLTHDICRNEFRQFLQDIRRYDLIKILDLWDLANDIRIKTPDSPERQRKLTVLKEKINNEPSFSVIEDDEANIALTVNERASEKLSKTHRHFVHYLTRKYRQFVRL